MQEIGEEEYVWLSETVEIVDRIRGLAGHIVGSMDCFEFQLDEDWRGVFEAIEWIRLNLGLLLQ